MSVPHFITRPKIGDGMSRYVCSCSWRSDTIFDEQDPFFDGVCNWETSEKVASQQREEHWKQARSAGGAVRCILDWDHIGTLRAILHQLSVGKASEGCKRDTRNCAVQLKTMLAELGLGE